MSIITKVIIDPLKTVHEIWMKISFGFIYSKMYWKIRILSKIEQVSFEVLLEEFMKSDLKFSWKFTVSCMGKTDLNNSFKIILKWLWIVRDSWSVKSSFLWIKYHPSNKRLHKIVFGHQTRKVLNYICIFRILKQY